MDLSTEASRPMLLCVTLCPKTVKILAVKGLTKMDKETQSFISKRVWKIITEIVLGKIISLRKDVIFRSKLKDNKTSFSQRLFKNKNTIKRFVKKNSDQIINDKVTKLV